MAKTAKIDILLCARNNQFRSNWGMKTAKALFKEARAQGFSWAKAAENAYFTQNPGAQLVRFTSLYQLLTTSFSMRLTPEGTEYWLNAIHELNGRDFGRDFQPKSKPSDFSSENKRRDFQFFEKETQKETQKEHEQ